MRSLLVLAVAIAASHGSGEWFDFRVGNEFKLPTGLDEALAKKYEPVEKDDKLGITWYSNGKDCRILVAFDGRKSCAGVRLVIAEKDIDSSNRGMYENKNGIFEKGTYNGEACYLSTMLFTPTRILENGGRRMLPDDEVALGLNLKRGDKYKQLDREGCENSKRPYTEQGCDNGYGLVFSKFSSKSSCATLVPFYAIYDPKERGNLIGFGWLSTSKYSDDGYETKNIFSTIKEKKFRELFPHSPDCLASFAAKGLTRVTVWLSYADSKDVACTSGKWTDTHCESKMQTKDGDDGAGIEPYTDSDED